MDYRTLTKQFGECLLMPEGEIELAPRVRISHELAVIYQDHRYLGMQGGLAFFGVKNPDANWVKIALPTSKVAFIALDADVDSLRDPEAGAYIGIPGATPSLPDIEPESRVGAIRCWLYHSITDPYEDHYFLGSSGDFNIFVVRRYDETARWFKVVIHQALSPFSLRS